MTKLIKPEELKLSNGIPVVLQNYDGPVAATYWWVKTGSADEAPAEAGFAHFLEHMLFKDAAAKETGRTSTGQTARAIESLGGDINAYTSFDQTVYHVTCAAHHWEKVIDVFGAMGHPQKFLKKDFESEREVILEELRKNEDSPDRQLFQSLFTSTFQKHPYGKPVIGYVKTLKAANVQGLEAFYKRNYVPENMGILLVGPVGDESKKKALLKLLEKHFGASKLKARGKFARRARPIEPAERKAPTVVARPFDVKTPTLSLSFRAPELRHEDIPALDLLSSILGMGELGRLYQRLFYGKSLVTNVSGSLYVPSDAGMLYFSAEVDSMEKIMPAAEEILLELKRACEEDVTDEELKRVLVSAESERLYATQSADGMAGRLGFLRFILGDLDFDRDYLDELRAVDAQKIREIARKYFTPERMSAAVLIPKDQAKSFDSKKVATLAGRILSGTAASKPAAAKPARLKKSADGSKATMIKRPSGVTVVYQERPQSHVASIHASMLGGLRLELGAPIESAEKDWGASYLLSLTWTKGTPAHDAKGIAKIVEGHAAGMDGFAGRNTIGLQSTSLAKDWDTISDLFSEVLVAPSFPEEEVEHSRRIAEDGIRGIEDHSSQLCTRLFLESLFEKHPYGKLTIGSLESVRSVNSAKLKALHRAWLRPERLVISVVGAVKPAKLDRWLDDLDLRLKSLASPPKLILPESLPDEAELKAPRWAEKHLGREQLHILVGGLGSKLHSDERFAIRLLHTLLGGQSGRLFIELREKKSLAYTVAPTGFDGIERGYLGTYIACSPQKRDEAIAGIQKVLETLATKGPTAAEMERAKEFYMGRRAMDLQGDGSMASHYGIEATYGIAPVSDAEALERIRKVTMADLKKVCRKYLVEPHKVTSVVG